MELTAGITPVNLQQLWAINCTSNLVDHFLVVAAGYHRTNLINWENWGFRDVLYSTLGFLWRASLHNLDSDFFSFVTTGRVHRDVGGSGAISHPQSAAYSVCNKMGSCSRLSLNSSSTAILAHEPALIGVETCSDDVDQYSRCRCTTDRAKPRPRILLLLLNAAYNHGCPYTSGCCRLALVLLFFALLFQAAAPSPDPFASPYPGWDRIPINGSTNNIETYFYYPVIEGMDF